jgi:hypothetical protein
MGEHHHHQIFKALKVAMMGTSNVSQSHVMKLLLLLVNCQ